MHASASPFESFAERTKWLAADIASGADLFPKLRLGEGITKETLKAWAVDSQVVIPEAEGKKGSLCDQVEDIDAED